MQPPCSATVVSVDSEGEVEGDLCCYDVTQNDNDGDIRACIARA